jgi:hypothetical protein
MRNIVCAVIANKYLGKKIVEVFEIAASVAHKLCWNRKIDPM